MSSISDRLLNSLWRICQFAPLSAASISRLSCPAVVLSGIGRPGDDGSNGGVWHSDGYGDAGYHGAAAHAAPSQPLDGSRLEIVRRPILSVVRLPERLKAPGVVFVQRLKA